MLFYALQRLGLCLLICVTAMVLLFSMIYAIPGDPATIALGPRATESMKAALHARMGLDEPLPMQLVYFFGNILQGDLGVDVWSQRSVAAIIAQELPYTLSLAFAGLAWAVLLGIPLGCYSAVKRGTFVDRLTGVISVGTITMPSFVVGIYGLLLFAVVLKWFPALGAGERGDPLDQLYHLVLPAFAVGLGWVGYLARLVRASMLEVMGENHIRTARAFGLPERTVILRYALRIAVLPTVTLLAIAMGNLLSSAVFAEVIFTRPGIGKLVFDAAITRNYPVVMGAVLVTVGLFALFSLISDLLIAWLDPRVRASL